jgi:hypothetical protein
MLDKPIQFLDINLIYSVRPMRPSKLLVPMKKKSASNLKEEPSGPFEL